MIGLKKLGIKHFREVFSKDKLPQQMKNNEVGIINLDDYIGPGPHWVTYRNWSKYAEYFDSFGLTMPDENAIYLVTGDKQLIYSSNEI